MISSGHGVVNYPVSLRIQNNKKKSPKDIRQELRTRQVQYRESKGHDK